MITETEPVQRVLDELRRLQGGEKIEFPDLVVRGAEDKIRELRAQSEQAREAREALAGWVLAGDGPEIDVAAADEVKHLGLVANYEE